MFLVYATAAYISRHVLMLPIGLGRWLQLHSQAFTVPFGIYIYIYSSTPHKTSQFGVYGSARGWPAASIGSAHSIEDKRPCHFRSQYSAHMHALAYVPVVKRPKVRTTMRHTVAAAYAYVGDSVSPSPPDADADRRRRRRTTMHIIVDYLHMNKRQ